MSSKLQNKIAIVTGASKGIGASIAKHLAAAGASVVVNYSTSKEGADRVVSEIVKKGGKAIAVQADVSHLEDIKKLIAETIKAYKKIDILINNAGIYEFASLEEITEEHFHKMFNLNVLGLLLVTREASKHFPTTGGSIVNISSVASILGMPGTSVYGATKASVDLITKTLSKELGARQIRVNSINPGMVETEGIHSAGFDKGDFRDGIVAKTALGRVGQPEDIAPLAVFLASDESSWITGETYFISGGLK